MLKPLDKEDLMQLLQRAIENDVELKKLHIELRETSAMLRYSGGDARKLLNILELVVEATPAGEDVVVTCSRTLLHTIRMERCTMTSSLPS